ncbi:AMP-binding protein [Jatrophihabitans cynanchi]|uniref:AMP-binding protein n=1 Tax=Jatrophihabitans cynanchi TaxID=2944128 RepID=A0ABY7K2G6_9ACTN|nr:AMP-binding protein [Jatrophihabitans sp. SB3-54]WAX59034.1 AMP-binding protein [Jatrophihabitans sp. SB3-54]
MYYPLTVRDFLDRAEQVYPDRVAVVDEPDQPAPSLGSITFREFAGLARAHAARLDQLGVPVGGRVAVVSQNSARFLAMLFGGPGWGRVLVPVNFRLAPAEVVYIIEHSGAEVVYVDPANERIVEAIRAIEGVRYCFMLGHDENLFAEDAEPKEWETPDEGATATINYTSGTTARPKGVQLTHRNLWLNTTIMGLQLGVNDRDAYLHTLPMFHANGWGMPFVLAACGVPQIVLRQIDGAEILRRVKQHRITLMCAAPTVVNAALDAGTTWVGEIPGRGLTRILVAGAPPPTRTIQRVLDELGWEFCQLYGLTETSPIVTMNRMRAEWDELSSADRAKRLSRAGVPALGVRLSIDVDGEVITASNHNLDGYWNQPEETHKAQAGNWFHTGDGGRIDEEGYLIISDRKKDVIISGGENVSSIEVEDALTTHPAVREAAVIGVPDEAWGELVTGIVVSDGSPVDEAELIAHCKSLLAGYKCPKQIEFVEELPRTATGKLQKFKIREPYWQGLERQVN